jgi:hypothetical protein
VTAPVGCARVLTRNAMIQALSRSGRDSPVLDAMTAIYPPSPTSRLEPVLQLLQGRHAPAVGVVDWEGRLVGYITSENIGELMMVESAGLGLRPRRPTPLLPQSPAWRFAAESRLRSEMLER